MLSGELPGMREGVALAPMTTIGVGGEARWFAVATEDAQVAAAHAWSLARDLPILILGGGSNLIIADEGFNGLVLQMRIAEQVFAPHRDGTTLITAGAGGQWDDLVAASVARGLAGLECLSGIPGTVGGTPIQNVGAYGQEVADVIEAVDVFDTDRATVATLSAQECGFSYRNSRFKMRPHRYVVTRVVFRLKPGEPSPRYPDLLEWLARNGIDRPTLANVRDAVLAVRRTKGMVVDPADPDSRSVGSFFMNPVVTPATREHVARVAGAAPPAFAASETSVKIPAAWLIERAGFRKGYADGRVGLSSKHPLALVNRGGATARDVVRLAAHIKRMVADRFGVLLRPEPVFVGFGEDPELAYLRE